MNSFKKIHCANILLAIALIIFIFSTGTPVQAADQASEIAQSFSQYFSPKVLRAMDTKMKIQFACESEGYWKIWTYGFHRNYKGVDGKKFEVILNWDGYYYIKSVSALSSELITTGDWTTLK